MEIKGRDLQIVQATKYLTRITYIGGQAGSKLQKPRQQNTMPNSVTQTNEPLEVGLSGISY